MSVFLVLMVTHCERTGRINTEGAQTAGEEEIKTEADGREVNIVGCP